MRGVAQGEYLELSLKRSPQLPSLCGPLTVGHLGFGKGEKAEKGRLIQEASDKT